MKKLPVVIFVFISLSLNPLNLVLAKEGVDSSLGSPTKSTSLDSTKTKEEIKIEIEQNRKVIQTRMQERENEVKERIASRSVERKEKLEERKLKICENRKGNIVNRANKITSSAKKHFDRFGEIVAKTDKFYTEKLVPKGVVVSNYTTLKADIATQKAAVGKALADMKAKIAAFDCAGLNPKGQLEDFKAQAKIVHESMKDYRTTIQNFIKAVKTAVEEKKSATRSAEPELN